MLTDGLWHGHGEEAVIGQVTLRPDNRVHLLLDVDGDGHDAAGVCPHCRAPVE